MEKLLKKNASLENIHSMQKQVVKEDYNNKRHEKTKRKMVLLHQIIT